MGRWNVSNGLKKPVQRVEETYPAGRRNENKNLKSRILFFSAPLTQWNSCRNVSIQSIHTHLHTHLPTHPRPHTHRVNRKVFSHCQAIQLENQLVHMYMHPPLTPPPPPHTQRHQKGIFPIARQSSWRTCQYPCTPPPPHTSTPTHKVNSKVLFYCQAIRLENQRDNEHRYMALVSTMGRQDTEESVILGLDCTTTAPTTTTPATPPSSPTTPGAAAAVPFEGRGVALATIGLVLPIWMGMKVRLNGDGWVEGWVVVS